MRRLGALAIFVGLSVLTQIGGLAYLLALGATRLQRFRAAPSWRRQAVVAVAAVVVYAVMTAIVAPPLAEATGRQRLPCGTGGDGVLVAAGWLTCALNRGYVTPDLGALLADLGEAAARRFPGSRVTTLEGNFPFFDGFPLLPHLSHRDGKKVDLAFFYEDRDGVAITEGSPSWLGYFVFEQPRTGDRLPCAEGFYPLRWDFDLLQPEDSVWRLDARRTAWMVAWLKSRPEVSKVFIEPHLADRMGVGGGKVRFQGCHAARHDDHVHVEMR